MKQRSPPRSVLAAHGLALGYGRGPVLRDVDLEVSEGEFWFFVGRNGTGKTTLLRGILRALSPLAGTLTLDPDRACFAAIGFVPQRTPVQRGLPLTLREFVRLGLVGLPVDPARERRVVREVLAELELDALSGVAVAELSGGQLQRASLARALVRQPRTLLLDEPTSGLDVTARHGLVGRLADLNRDRGLTVVVVTHELDLAVSYASHVALFADGTLVAGAREQVLTRERLEASYGLSLRIDAEGVHVDAPRGRGSGPQSAAP